MPTRAIPSGFRSSAAASNTRATTLRKSRYCRYLVVSTVRLAPVIATESVRSRMVNLGAQVAKRTLNGHRQRPLSRCLGEPDLNSDQCERGIRVDLVRVGHRTPFTSVSYT